MTCVFIKSNCIKHLNKQCNYDASFDICSVTMNNPLSEFLTCLLLAIKSITTPNRYDNNEKVTAFSGSDKPAKKARLLYLKAYITAK